MAKNSPWMRAAAFALAAWAVFWIQWAVWSGPRSAVAAATPERPNIVLFVIDTLRADRVNCYGYDQSVTTPRLDALASEGVRFEQAYSPSPWTLPTMASVMLSRFACEHGALSTRTKLPSGIPTMPQRLQKLGYNTLGLYANGMVAAEFGFDRGYRRYQPSGVNSAEQVAELLRQASGGPFFLYVHNIEPHNPERDAPPVAGISAALREEMHERYKAYRSATRVDFTLGRSAGLTDTTAEQDEQKAFFREHLEEWSQLYDAAIHLSDERLGSVIDWLRERGEWDNTLFIVMSDHGEEFFEHGGWTHGQAVYEEQIRVPLVIRFPGGRFAGRTFHEPTSLVDLMPTIFSWLDRMEDVTDAAGRDLLAALEGGEHAAAALDDSQAAAGLSSGSGHARGCPCRSSPGPRMVAVRHDVMNHYRPFHKRRGEFNLVIRDGRWKAIWNVEPDRVELYDLCGDPHERHDRSADEPETAARLRAWARDWLDGCRPVAAPGAQKIGAMESDTLRNLRALGYAD